MSYKRTKKLKITLFKNSVKLDFSKKISLLTLNTIKTNNNNGKL